MVGGGGDEGGRQPGRQKGMFEWHLETVIKNIYTYKKNVSVFEQNLLDVKTNLETLIFIFVLFFA